MKIFGLEIKRAPSRKVTFRNYAGAKSDRLTADWITTNLVSDEILRWHLSKLRSRSRDLANNNDYMKNFLRKLKVNVIGPNGIGMQSKARLRNGNLDKRSNEKIEEAWQNWTKKANISVCGTLTFKDFISTAIETVARDGEVLIRKIKGYDNKFSYALQLLEADHLDENLNQDLANGNKIRLGIEKNRWGKPIAYHLLEKHPGETLASGQSYVRIPAEEIIHIFIKERPTQSRGVPWAHTAIIRLRMLGLYEEAALVNARIGASKMQAIIMSDSSGEFTGDGKDAYNNVVDEVEPGMRELLPPGTTLHDFNPQYPSQEYAPFNKAALRGIASGLGCSYNSLANDLEGVNFSSLRSGLLEERDGWKAIQSWFIENVLEEIFPVFLEMAILSGELNLSYAEIQRLTAPKWQGRRWEWVDPEKDINARITALSAGLTTRTRICAEQGDDFEEILEELKEEKKIITDSGLSFFLDAIKKPENNPAEPEEDMASAATGGDGNGKNH